MKTKKTVTPFNMQEIARALREMISEDSPNASEALLSGTREAVFRVRGEKRCVSKFGRSENI